MIHIFYHSSDLDGHCSGAICKYALPDAALHGINYGDPFPWESIQPEDKVYMVDFSLQPFSDMFRLHDACAFFYWVDHHKSAILEYQQQVTAAGVPPVRERAAQSPSAETWHAVLDTDHAACELCWMAFVTQTLPLSVYWLGRYDIWKHEDVPGSLEFQYGMRLYDTWPDNQELWKELFTNAGRVSAIAEQGEMLLRYERLQNKKFAAAYAFETELDGLKCIAVNKGFTNSLVFESVYDPERHDAMLSFAYRNGKWTISLYATKPEIDVSVICKARGGGGHKGAAGFQCDTLPFLME